MSNIQINPISKRPNFFIVGAFKCGTTAMYAYLDAHPQIYMSPVKEPNYFGLRDHSPKSESQYLDLFANVADQKCIGEASPVYLFSEKSTQAINQFSKDAKIIIMIRNHADWLYSRYWQAQKVGRDKSSTFEVFLEKRKINLKDSMPYFGHYESFAKYIKLYFDTFDHENVQVIVHDDLKSNPTAVYNSTLNFLGVQANFTPNFTPINTRKRIRSQTIQNMMLGLGINTTNVKRFRHSKLMSLYVKYFPKTLSSSLSARLSSTISRIYYTDNVKPIDDNIRKELNLHFCKDTDAISNLLGVDLSYWYNDV